MDNMENNDVNYKQLDIKDVENCYICGAVEKRSGNSLHCWDIEYECGCKIIGAIGGSIYLERKCPSDKI